MSEREAREVARLSASAISLPYQPRPRAIRARISRVSGYIMLAVAGTVLLAWIAGWTAPTQIAVGWAAMSFNTALSFLLLGITFVLPGGAKDPAHLRNAGRTCAALAALFTLLSLVQFFAGVDFGAGEIFYRYRMDQALPVMSAATATGILFIAIAALLVTWTTRSGLRPALVLGFLGGVIGLTGLVGHLYDAESLYSVPYFYGLSFHTSLLLAVAAIGILGVHPDTGPLGVLAAEGRGSRLARRLLPFAIVVPILIGWARLAGERSGLYELEFGLALFATANVLVLITLIWLTATSLNREDILRRRADEAREHDAIRRRILFEQAKDGILVMGPEQRVVEANRSFADMIGYPQNVVTTLHPWDWIVDNETRERMVADWTQIASDGATFEARLRKRDGSIIDAEVSCTTARFDAQQFLFFVCRDITGRKQSEQALHASEQRFRRALANIPDVVIIYDTDLRMQYVNNASRSVSGLPPEQLLGKRDEDVLPREVCDTYLPTLRRAFLTKQICAVEADIELPETGLHSLRITCVPLMDKDGEVREVLGITRDLTDRKRAEHVIRESEAKFRNLIDQAAAGIVICDRKGNIELVNSHSCELLSCTENDLLGKHRDSLLGPAADAGTLAQLARMQPGDVMRIDREMQRTDGGVFPAEISVNVLESGEQQILFQDITTRVQQEHKIARLSRIRAVMSSINSAIVRLRNRRELLQEACRVAVEDGSFCVGWIGIIDDASDELQLVAQAGLGDQADELMDEPVALVSEGPAQFALFQQQPSVNNDIRRQADASPLRALAVRNGAASAISLPLVVEGETRGVMALYAGETNYFDDDEIALLRELAEDVSFGLEFIAKEEKVDYLAYYDSVSGLANRSLFFHRLGRQLQEATEQELDTILIVIDINRFRAINESYGRFDADALLAELAERMTGAVSENATVARIASNVFAIAMNDRWDDFDAAFRLDALNHALFDAAFRLGDDDVRISATSGVAVYPGDADSPEVLLANAETALRNAKDCNQRYTLYSRAMNEQVAETMRLENKVRDALLNGELSMWYQPKVCARTGTLLGLEALMRWKDSETGSMVPPDRFIPVMERTGLILDAGRWALQQVASDCLRWQEQGVSPPRVAVNVSPIQLQQQDLVGSLIEAQIVANDAGTAIDLEITESVIMGDVDAIIPKLRTLASVGTRIHVDDFGTGYSSLAYIARLPIHALKIDRSFVSDLNADSDGLPIVKSIISLAKATRLQVIAEGVESEEQAAILRDLSCDELQGYHIGRPLPADETLSVIAALSEAPKLQA